MFTTIFCFFVLFTLCLSIGKQLLTVFQKDNLKHYNVFEIYFIGIASISSFLVIWSLFLPTNYWSLLFLMIVTLIDIIKNFKEYKNSIVLSIKFGKQKYYFLLFFIPFIFYAIIRPKNFDTYLYHIQAIMWNENYSVVPGLANFYDRLGFNSSLYVLSAGFSFTVLYNQLFFIVCSLTFFVFLCWILHLIFKIKNDFKKIILLLFIFFFTEQYGSFISSPDSDLMSNLIFSFSIISLIINKNELDKKWFLLVFISMYCVTIKLLTLPILLVSIYAVYQSKKDLFNTLKYSFIIGTFLIVPWLIRNVIISGYIIYPNTFLDVFSFDWKVPVGFVEVTKSWIYSFGRIPFMHYSEVLSMPFSKWFPVWWEASLLKTKILFVFCTISPIISSFIIFKYHKKNKATLFIALLVCITAFLIWLLTAPDIRFSSSIVVLLAFFPALLIKNSYSQHTKRFDNIIASLVIAFLINFSINGYNLFSSQYKLKNIMSYIYLPKDVFYVKKEKAFEFREINLKTATNKNIVIYSAIGDTQTYDKFPCTVNINYVETFKLRGEDLQDGFIPSK